MNSSLMKKYFLPSNYASKINYYFSNIQYRKKLSNVLKSNIKSKIGLEIGGPSRVFKTIGILPAYNNAKQIDGVNFSTNTVWTGNIGNQPNYCVGRKHLGELYILDGTNLKIDNGGITSNKYDFLLSCNNLEHIANPLLALEQWLIALKSDGYLILVLPKKESNFDHNREVTPFSHILSDYKNGIGEDDLTHYSEIINLHDLSMDPHAGAIDKFIARSKENYNNRCFHHHVFDSSTLEEISKYFKLNIRNIFYTSNDWWLIAQK